MSTPGFDRAAVTTRAARILRNAGGFQEIVDAVVDLAREQYHLGTQAAVLVEAMQHAQAEPERPARMID